MVVKVGRHGWSNLDRIATWRVHGRSVVAMGHTSVRDTGVGNVGGPREPWCTLIDRGSTEAPGDHSAVGSDSTWVQKKNPIFNGAARPLPVLRFTSRMVENDRVEEKAIFGPCCVFPFWTPKSPFLHTSTPSPPKIFLAPNGASPHAPHAPPNRYVDP